MLCLTYEAADDLYHGGGSDTVCYVLVELCHQLGVPLCLLTQQVELLLLVAVAEGRGRVALKMITGLVS